jgi:hypothetical protein
MKRSVLIAFIASAIALFVKVATGQDRAYAPPREVAVVEFAETVKLLDVFLRGQYLVVHDEEKMAQGEPCLYVFRYAQGQKGKLVASFHCKPASRERVARFRVIVSKNRTPYDVPEVREIQFAGSTMAHRVP